MGTNLPAASSSSLKYDNYLRLVGKEFALLDDEHKNR